MNEYFMCDAVGFLDDELIDRYYEIKEKYSIKRKRRKALRIKCLSVAACLCVVFGLTIPWFDTVQSKKNAYGDEACHIPEIGLTESSEKLEIGDLNPGNSHTNGAVTLKIGEAFKVKDNGKITLISYEENKIFIHLVLERTLSANVAQFSYNKLSGKKFYASTNGSYPKSDGEVEIKTGILRITVDGSLCSKLDVGAGEHDIIITLDAEAYRSLGAFYIEGFGAFEIK